MNIKKLNISFDNVSGKIMFDIDVDGITCHGGVDAKRLEDITDLLYTVEESCGRIRSKISAQIAEKETAYITPPLIPGHEYVNNRGERFHCLRISREGVLFQNMASGWRFMAHNVVMHEDSTIEWDYSSDGRFAGDGI